MRAEAEIDIESYRAHAPDPEQDPRRARWHQERYRFAARRHPAPTRVADLGCGLGLGLPVLQGVADSIYAADINPQVVEHLAATHRSPGIEFGVFDVMEGPLPGEPYDLICLFEVIEHLEDPGAALENLKASLRPGGLVVLSTPNSEDGDTGSHPYHVYQFSQETLAGLLRKHFELVEVYSQGAPKRRRVLEERKEGSALVRLLRRLDILHLRDRVPFGLRRMAIRGATGVDLKEVREEVHTIDPELREDARWTVAVCG